MTGSRDPLQELKKKQEALTSVLDDLRRDPRKNKNAEAVADKISRLNTLISFARPIGCVGWATFTRYELDQPYRYARAGWMQMYSGLRADCVERIEPLCRYQGEHDGSCSVVSLEEEHGSHRGPSLGLGRLPQVFMPGQYIQWKDGYGLYRAAFFSEVDAVRTAMEWAGSHRWKKIDAEATMMGQQFQYPSKRSS